MRITTEEAEAAASALISRASRQMDNKLFNYARADLELAKKILPKGSTYQGWLASEERKLKDLTFPSAP